MRTFNDKHTDPLRQTTIKESKIDGLGLHVKPKSGWTCCRNCGRRNHVLVHNRDRLNGLELPLGGLINHSDIPTVILLQKRKNIAHN